MFFSSNLVMLDLDLDPDPDSDPHSEKLLDPDPHKMKECGSTALTGSTVYHKETLPYIRSSVCSDSRSSLCSDSRSSLCSDTRPSLCSDSR